MVMCASLYFRPLELDGDAYFVQYMHVVHSWLLSHLIL